jgi:RHS repeat-associated protein
MLRKYLTLTITIVFSLLFQLLLTPFVYAEEVRMDYTDPNHLHAPKVVNGVTYQYDENGNLVNDGERTLEWNEDNLPIKITKGNTEVRFFYDASGTRIAKETKDLTTGNITNKTIYVNQYLTIKQGNNVTSNNLTIYQKYYFADGKRIATSHQSLTTIHQPFTNHLPAMLRIALQAGQQPITNFIHHDHLGSTVLTTDINSQPVSNSLSYFPYGNFIPNYQLPITNYLYTNQELDPESDLYNYNARFYNPRTGAFISADAVGSGNRYAYAANNPMIFTDPTGHADTPFDGGGGGGGPYLPLIMKDYYSAWIGPIPEEGDKAPWMLEKYQYDYLYWAMDVAVNEPDYNPYFDERVLNDVLGEEAIQTWNNIRWEADLGCGSKNISPCNPFNPEGVKPSTTATLAKGGMFTSDLLMGMSMAKSSGLFSLGAAFIKTNQRNPKKNIDVQVEDIGKNPSLSELQLSPLEQRAVELAREGKSTCSSHLADMGLIKPNETKQIHEALRRVAIKAGIYETNRWIGRLGNLIYGD